MIDFIGFNKIARLRRDIIITEKLDGTNAQITITEDGQFLTGSRNRWITPEDDNYGFSKWANDNKEELLKLGKGTYFGEWFGCGIQRKYNLKEKRFSLFNTSKWCLYGETPKLISKTNPSNPNEKEKYQDVLPKCCGLVPVLYQGIFDTSEINKCIEHLKENGSVAAPGFMNPEGIVIYHTASKTFFKQTIENDEKPKGA
jgi:hypothetical protein